MSDIVLKKQIKSTQDVSTMRSADAKSRWIKVFLSPLTISLLLTILIRTWLTIHTHGVIAGDEAIVGLQAEHILRGEHPIYYYSQPYMGSFEAYIMAGLFLLFGPSVWTLRAEPILISLVLITITWYFATALAEVARLTQRAKICFVTIATLIAAFPPLYDMVEEMRGKGGYTEAFTIMLWLLFCAWRLTSRWHNDASPRELVLRWAGIGFLSGFGLWLDPLVAYALVASMLWIGIFFIAEVINMKRHATTQALLRRLREALLALVTLPTALIGFSPALYWGIHHQWANIAYIFANGTTSTSQNKLYTFVQVEKTYLTCIAPRAIGGALPTQPNVTVANPHILTLGLLISAGCICICTVALVLSWIWPQTVLTSIRRLTAILLLFCVCASVIFGTASISVQAIFVPCGPWDVIGRYTVPLVIALPFIIATVFTLPLMMSDKEITPLESERRDPKRTTRFSAPALSALKIVMLVVLIAYFVAQSIAYKSADPGRTFQESGGAANYPSNNDPIIAYMVQEHIHYAWGTGWIADPITFKTNGSIIVAEPHGRIKSNDDAVLHADRASFMLLVGHYDTHPTVLKLLDAQHVHYHTARFYSEPGIDVLVITPLNRTLSPSDPNFAAVFTQVLDNFL